MATYRCINCGQKVTGTPSLSNKCSDGKWDHSFIQIDKPSNTQKSGTKSWDNSPLGATTNIIGKGIKKASEYNSREARGMRETKRLQDEKMQEIEDAQQRREDKKLADKTINFYNVVKPYLKFIIPIYIVAFVITFLIVEEKDRMITGVIFGFPIVYVIYLAYNVFSNRSK